MLNPVRFRVSAGESGPLDITLGGPDYAAMEAKYSKPVLTLIGEGWYEPTVYGVWHAAHREGKVTSSFDEFLALTPSWERAAEMDEVTPLGEAAPTGQ